VSDSDYPGAYDFTSGADDLCLDFDLEDDINDENEHKYVPSYLKSKNYSDGFPGYFKDVKKRPKHLHCRCATCAELQADLIRACQTVKTVTFMKRKHTNIMLKFVVGEHLRKLSMHLRSIILDPKLYYHTMTLKLSDFLVLLIAILKI
jgi:hypothetical protein